MRHYQFLAVSRKLRGADKSVPGIQFQTFSQARKSRTSQFFRCQIEFEHHRVLRSDPDRRRSGPLIGKIGHFPEDLLLENSTNDASAFLNDQIAGKQETE